jgi:hypothetical protein
MEETPEEKKNGTPWGELIFWFVVVGMYCGGAFVYITSNDIDTMPMLPEMTMGSTPSVLLFGLMLLFGAIICIGLALRHVYRKYSVKEKP